MEPFQIDDPVHLGRLTKDDTHLPADEGSKQAAELSQFRQDGIDLVAVRKANANFAKIVALGKDFACNGVVCKVGHEIQEATLS